VAVVVIGLAILAGTTVFSYTVASSKAERIRAWTERCERAIGKEQP
jgi:hypothetical protein